jgi:uncharacterized integral membrane protein (TIGR00697 family)
MNKVDSAKINDGSLKWYWPLILLYVSFQLISDVTAGKVTQIGPAVVSVTVLYFPITYLISDILTEVYGFERARRALFWVLGASILAGFVYQLAIALPPGPGFSANAAYTAVLGAVPRVLVAGWVAVFAGDIVNNFVMSKMKIATGGRWLWSRTIGSTIAGQGVNTALFYVGALWGILPSNVLISAIFWGWAIKVTVEVIMTPVTYAAVNRIKKAEGFDAFDETANYNPFKLT